MATEITTVEHSHALTLWRKPSLTAALKELVDKGSSLDRMPIVSPADVERLKAYIAHPDPPKASEDWIEAQLGSLSIKPQRTRGNLEARQLVEIYVPIMAEHAQADLGYAVGRWMREEKWFPEISDIVKLANFAKGMRDYKKLNAQMLIHKHKREWRETIKPSDVCSEEDRARIKHEVAKEFASNGFLGLEAASK